MHKLVELCSYISCFRLVCLHHCSIPICMHTRQDSENTQIQASQKKGGSGRSGNEQQKVMERKGDGNRGDCDKERELVKREADQVGYVQV